MNRRILASVCGVACVGGVLVLVVPQHALSIGRLGATTAAVMVGALVLGAVGPFVSRPVPTTGLDVEQSAGATPLDPHGLRDARRDLDLPAAPGRPPTAVRDRLVLAATMRLQAVGVDLDDPRSRPRAEEHLAAETWRVLTEPAPSGSVRASRPSATLTERILDELDALDRPTGATHDRHR